MNSSTRRLVAVTVAGALVSAPALAFGGAAQASTVAPRGLLDGVVTSVLGGTTGSAGATSVTDPVGALLETVISTLDQTTGSTGDTGAGTGTTSPVDTLTDTLTSVLTGTDDDPQQMVADLTTQLTSQLSGVEGGQELIDALRSGDPQDLINTLVTVLPISSVFPTGLPTEVSDVLNGPEPTDTGELIAAMTEYYKRQNMTADQVKNDNAAKALPASVLAALLAALEKKSTTKPTASRACISATKKVTRLHKQLRAAKKHHQRARAHSLTKRLAGAKRAKRRAC